MFVPQYSTQTQPPPQEKKSLAWTVLWAWQEKDFPASNVLREKDLPASNVLRFYGNHVGIRMGRDQHSVQSLSKSKKQVCEKLFSHAILEWTGDCVLCCRALSLALVKILSLAKSSKWCKWKRFVDKSLSAFSFEMGGVQDWRFAPTPEQCGRHICFQSVAMARWLQTG